MTPERCQISWQVKTPEVVQSGAAGPDGVYLLFGVYGIRHVGT